MNIGTMGSMVMIAKSWDIFSFGFRLLKKKNKDPDEMKAAGSFRTFICLTAILVLAAAIVIMISVGTTLAGIRMGSGGNKRYGTVSGEYIRYVQGENKYLKISETGLDAYELRDGDRILMIFDRGTDQLKDLVPETQYEKRMILHVTALLCTMLGCVLLLIAFALIAQGTFGRPFVLYYNLSLKRENPAWEAEPRRRLYEEHYAMAFAQKKSIWLSALIALVFLLLLGGFSLSGVLVSGEVYTLLPDRGLVLISRILGGCSGLVYIILLFLLVRFDDRIRPLYSVGEHLLHTQTFTRNEAGRPGYYTRQGEWIQLEEVKVKRQDEKIVRLKCRYRVNGTGKEFSRDNYIAREDPMFHSVMALSASQSGGSLKRARNIWLLWVILFIYIILTAGNLILLRERDKNATEFQATERDYRIGEVRTCERSCIRKQALWKDC